ncbi:benenodin family lasso peptide [Novosphingobium sp. RL4]|nr:benenodin family lasso peptide [Novosphingobium sp. RL4]WRT94459.1 benenodin family lasso peptide [Novosphingobium sp. RL4]
MVQESDTIDLGTASVETKGPIGTGGDFVLAQNQPGLSDD